MGYWFLAPDFTFRKDGPIRLGTVLGDPLRPTLILASEGNGLPDDLELPPQGSIEETAHEHNRDAATSGRLALWADFLQTASASASASADLSRNRDFGKVDHEIWSFDREFSDASLKKIASVPKVYKHIHSGFLSRRPVYVITGVRVAKTSFSVSASSTTTLTSEAAASVSDPTHSVPVTVGAEGGAQVTRSAGDSYNTAPGIVFAYRVHVLRTKRDGDVEEELFSHKAAYLTAASDSGLECVQVTPQILKEYFETSVGVHEHGEDVWSAALNTVSAT